MAETCSPASQPRRACRSCDLPTRVTPRCAKELFLAAQSGRLLPAFLTHADYDRNNLRLY
ncbi:hypothetical protein MPLA_340049 [Mesorhizobium sp. ORS 3359]|nr:hypothetical protein MPLA_340049 [Mesorhizobium sp. ORS 3359]